MTNDQKADLLNSLTGCSVLGCGCLTSIIAGSVPLLIAATYAAWLFGAI